MGNLTPALPQTYRRLIQQIAPEDKEVAWRALKWLVCGARLFMLSELITAAAIVPSESFFDPERKLDNHELLLDILGSLVKINPISQLVEIAHFSVTE